MTLLEQALRTIGLQQQELDDLQQRLLRANRTIADLLNPLRDVDA